jgi:hypothetical protein
VARLSEVKQKIGAGEVAAARRALVAYLNEHPRHVAAWRLLASLLDDPAKQADCYRRIVALAPEDTAAREKLARLRAQTTPPPASKPASRPEPPPEPELTVEEQVEAVLARLLQQADEVAPGTERRLLSVAEVQDALRAQGVALSDEELIHHIRAQGLQITHSPYSSKRIIRRPVVKEPYVASGWGWLGKAVQRLTGGRPQERVEAPSMPVAADELTAADIIQLAGGPLPPEERRTCPHCGATISKAETRCEWCGASLGEPNESDEPSESQETSEWTGEA